jgi:diguanylate cyclase (GGDEF)-like protein/PAS domain S-box-containing protein
MLPSLRHFLSLWTLLPIALIVAITLGFGQYIHRNLETFDVSLPTNILESQREAGRHIRNIADAMRGLEMARLAANHERVSLAREQVRTALKEVASARDAEYTAGIEVIRMRQTLDTQLRRIEAVFKAYEHAEIPSLNALNEAFSIAEQTQNQLRDLAAKVGDDALVLQHIKPAALRQFRDSMIALLALFGIGSAAMVLLIIARTTAASKLKLAQTQLTEAIEGVSESFVLFDPMDRLVLCNTKYREQNAAIQDLIAPDIAYEKLLRASLERGVIQIPEDMDADSFFADRLKFHRKASGTQQIQLQDGRWLQLSDRRTRDGGIVSVQTDVTELKLREQEYHRKALIFENMSDSVMIADLQGHILDWSPSAERATGYSKDDMLGQLYTELFLDVDAARLAHSITVKLKREGRWEGELRFRCKTGHIATWEMAVVSLCNEKGALIGNVAVARDVTMRKEAEARIEHMATHDYLTGLPNRTLFRDRLMHAIASARRRQESVAVLLFDLDNFKDVNDSLGHGAGDVLLMETTERLKQSIRDSDTIARLGGDEFAVIQTAINDQTSPSNIAARIRDAMASPFHIDSHEIHVSTSIGIAVFPENGQDPDELLKNADMALYLAKNEGRNNFQFFVPEMNREHQTRKELLTDLRHAIEENGFTLHFQPQISLRDSRIVGAEVLLRWPHEVRGLIPPAQFIPIAESSGLILSLGDWVLRTACRQIKAWIDKGMPSIRYSINLSALQFRHHDLVNSITETLITENVGPTQLELEITESVVMHNVEGAIKKMTRLADLGVKLAIDDFGTGYSSLSYLKRFPVQKVKIDGSFVQDITQDPDDAAIVKAVINLGHSMNLEVVAEGVETEEQLEFLRAEGCDIIQGYYYSRPVDADAFEVQLMKHLAGEIAHPAAGSRKPT